MRTRSVDEEGVCIEPTKSELVVQQISFKRSALKGYVHVAIV